MIFALTKASTILVEWWLSGVTSAISLYCGTKVPKNRRGKKK
jgi:hypothetical protein